MSRLATLVFLVLFAAAALIAVTTVAVRAVREARQRRRYRQAAGPRQALLRLAAGTGEPDQPADQDRDQHTEHDTALAELAELARLPDPAWRSVEPTAFGLLAKVRGSAHAALVEAFRRRGLVDRARNRLGSRSAPRRARAASALGSLGDQAAVPLLCRLLGDRRPDVRVAVIQALGRLGDPAAAPALVASVQATDPAPSQLVAHALAQLGPGAVPGLVAALDTGPALARGTVLDALRLLGAGTGEAPVEAPVVEVLLQAPEPEVRQRAAAALGRIGGRRAVDPLVAATGSNQPPAVRTAAAHALGELGEPAAATPLARLLDSPDPRIGTASAAALLRLGNAGATKLARAAARGGPAGAYAAEAMAIDELARQRAETVPHKLAAAGGGTRT